MSCAVGTGLKQCSCPLCLMSVWHPLLSSAVRVAAGPGGSCRGWATLVLPADLEVEEQLLTSALVSQACISRCWQRGKGGPTGGKVCTF
jgi:hypothetical protein